MIPKWIGIHAVRLQGRQEHGGKNDDRRYGVQEHTHPEEKDIDQKQGDELAAGDGHQPRGYGLRDPEQCKDRTEGDGGRKGEHDPAVKRDELVQELEKAPGMISSL